MNKLNVTIINQTTQKSKEVLVISSLTEQNLLDNLVQTIAPQPDELTKFINSQAATIQIEVASSWIESVLFQPATNKLTFLTKTGSKLVYRNVPFSVVRNGIETGSVGRWYNETIKYNYSIG